MHVVRVRGKVIEYSNAFQGRAGVKGTLLQAKRRLICHGIVECCKLEAARHLPYYARSSPCFIGSCFPKPAC